MNNAAGGDWPKISIITPSYNQGHFIEATIQSVLSQGYPALEYLVVDGGSSDGTLDILRKYSGQLHWISEADSGQAEAINKGLRLATGEILAYLNSDDLYLPGALQRVARFFMDHPQAAWVSGRCITVDTELQETRRLITRYKNLWLRTHSYPALLVLNYISQMATFWRRSVYAALGPLDEQLHYTMDYEYWLRIGKRHRLHTLAQELAVFRLHTGSKSGTTASKQFLEQYQVAASYHPPRPLLLLHRLHNWLSIRVYSMKIKG
jgi:glycosyltransferase involved in cell wall biosynthesis